MAISSRRIRLAIPGHFVAIRGVRRYRDSNLLKVAGANYTPGLLSGPVQCRQKYRHKQSDNRDYHQQFDQCETLFSFHGIILTKLNPKRAY
jgi:hypothetical protein